MIYGKEDIYNDVYSIIWRIHEKTIHLKERYIVHTHLTIDGIVDYNGGGGRRVEGSDQLLAPPKLRTGDSTGVRFRISAFKSQAPVVGTVCPTLLPDPFFQNRNSRLHLAQHTR